MVVLGRGEAVIFPNRERPVRGMRGVYRAQVRHGVSRLHAGANVGVGRDYTLFALIDGTVVYERLGKDRRRARVEPLSS